LTDPLAASPLPLVLAQIFVLAGLPGAPYAATGLAAHQIFVPAAVSSPPGNWEPARVTAPVDPTDVITRGAVPAGTALELGACDMRGPVTVH
jgi:hypothetical protein